MENEKDKEKREKGKKSTRTGRGEHEKRTARQIKERGKWKVARPRRYLLRVILAHLGL